MADIAKRINQVREEIDGSLDNGQFLHNIVVTEDARRQAFVFYCLANDRRWGEVAIGEDVLTGPLGRFGATVEHAVELVREQFPEMAVFDIDGEAVPSESVTGALPTADQLFAQSQAFFDTDPLDPQSPATGSLHLPPTTSPTAIPVSAAAASSQPSLLAPNERKSSLLDRLAAKLEGHPIADPIDDFRPHPGGER